MVRAPLWSASQEPLHLLQPNSRGQALSSRAKIS